MQILNSSKLSLLFAAASLLLAGCASNPAPIVNHSFGPGQVASAPVSSAQVAAAPGTSGGAQTFAAGHANGTVSAAGYTVAPGDTLYSIAFANGLDFRALAARNDIPPPYVIHPGQVLKLKPTGTPPGGTTVITTTNTMAAQPAASQLSAPVFGPVTTEPMTPNGVAPAASATAATVSSAVPAAAPSSVATAPAASAAPPPAPVPASASAPAATREVAGITWQWPATGKLISNFEAGRGGDGAGIDIAGKVGEPVRAAASGTVVYSGNGLIGYGELIIIKHNDTYLSAYGHNSRRLVKEGQHVSAGQEIALMGASGAPRVELHFEIRKNGKPVDPTDFLPKR